MSWRKRDCGGRREEEAKREQALAGEIEPGEGTVAARDGEDGSDMMSESDRFGWLGLSRVCGRRVFWSGASVGLRGGLNGEER